MNILFAIILLFLILIFRYRFTLQAKGIDNISTKELKEKLLDKQKQFIDVRTPEEYNRHHIDGFNNIPLKKLPDELDKLMPEKETIVICQSGIRSLRAAKQLKKAGFHHINNVKNGINAWY